MSSVNLGFLLIFKSEKFTCGRAAKGAMQSTYRRIVVGVVCAKGDKITYETTVSDGVAYIVPMVSIDNRPLVAYPKEVWVRITPGQLGDIFRKVAKVVLVRLDANRAEESLGTETENLVQKRLHA